MSAAAHTEPPPSSVPDLHGHVKDPTDQCTHGRGLPKPSEWVVPPDPGQVPAVRRAIVDQVRAWGLGLDEEVLADMRLCASEVIANAIVHTGQAATVTASWTGERLRIEVRDLSLRLPEAGAGTESTTHGRGLVLVKALAAAWGWHPAGAGKAVWFEVGSNQTVCGEGRLTTLIRVAAPIAAALGSTPQHEQARVRGALAGAL